MRSGRIPIHPILISSCYSDRARHHVPMPSGSSNTVNANRRPSGHVIAFCGDGAVLSSPMLIAFSLSVPLRGAGAHTLTYLCFLREHLLVPEGNAGGRVLGRSHRLLQAFKPQFKHQQRVHLMVVELWFESLQE